MKKIFVYCISSFILLLLASCRILPSSLDNIPISHESSQEATDAPIFYENVSPTLDEIEDISSPIYSTDAPPTPSNAKCIENTIRAIDKRVAWIYGRLGNPTLNSISGGRFDGIYNYEESDGYENYYDGERIMLREGYAPIYEEPGGAATAYTLHYDEEGQLIYADVFQYRYTTYHIYFHDGLVVRLIPGDIWNEEVVSFDSYMINAISLCLENAY